MKLDTRTKTMIVGVVVAAIALLSYFFGYKELKEDKAKLEKDIKSLDNQITIKKEKYEKKDSGVVGK